MSNCNRRARTNPFATSYLRPGAIPFLCPARFDIAALCARFVENGYRGEIVGAHGSGKSTLLAALAPTLRAAGHSVTLIELHDGQRSMPAGWHVGLVSHRVARGRTDDSMARRAIVIVDGYEQLGYGQRAWLGLRCRLGGWGLLVTAHRSVGLPTLCETKVDEAMARQVIQHLLREATDFQPGDVGQLLAAHDGNLREVLFDLYDRYERQRVE